MPHLRLSKIAAVTMLVAAQFLPANADYPLDVKGPNDLAKFALEIKNSNNRGPHSINFNYYGNVGTFSVDTPTDKVETLTFQRKHSDSDAVIKVSSTFLDIKKMPGKVVLRGMAFQLMPNAVLIAGADGLKPNGSLVIDSCFIFADTLDNTFLSWLGDNAGSVEISNSYFVVGGSKTALARMSLTAGSVKFNNNLINFSGAISATGVTKQFQFLANTVNRTQFELTGKIDAGQYPSLEFTRNLFTHRGTKDAFGGATFFVVYYGLFDPARILMGSNKMYNTWGGFDYPSNEKFTALGSTNSTIDSIPGKASNEKWNWYTENLDANQTGLLSGGIKREKYNVMPSDTAFNWSLLRGKLTVDFQAAPYPRMITLDTPGATVAMPNDAAFHRRIFPSSGYAHFGPFQVNRITLGASAEYGKPVLLALDSLDSARTQAGAAAYKDNPSRYKNGLGMARKFVLVNKGNTPQGDNVRPSDSSGLNVNYKLLFAKVDSAGETQAVDVAVAAQSLSGDLRSLEAGILLQTSSVSHSLLHIGAGESVSPYDPDKVFWLFKSTSDTLVHAVKSRSYPDSGKYVASANFSSSKGVHYAHLVEKLGIPAGGRNIKLSDGMIRVFSTGGFQLTVDSGHVVDQNAYGTPTKGYSFAWPVKTASDGMEISLKADADMGLFVKVGNALPVAVANATRDSSGLTYKLVDADKGKVFFAALEFNVLKGIVYPNITFDGVTLSGFRSSTSGRLGFDTLSVENQRALGSEVKDYRLLGGRQMRALAVATIRPDSMYSMIFRPGRGYRNMAKAEAYYHNGQAWSTEPLTGHYVGEQYILPQVPGSAMAIAVVERLEDAKMYVEAIPVVAGLNLTVTPHYIDTLYHITHYCVDLISVNFAGTVLPEECANSDKKEINQPYAKTLQPNNAYQIRIQYYMGEERINGRKYERLAGTTFSALSAAEPLDVQNKSKKIWHLVGFPVSGSFQKFMVKQAQAKIDSIIDTTLVLRIHKTAAPDAHRGAFDTLKTWATIPVKPGDAYLMASSNDFKTTVQPQDSALPLEPPHVLTLDTGWIFISNPYPINLVKSKISTSAAMMDRDFYRLDTVSKGKDKRSYAWTADSVLRPFFGYAYYALPGEKLTFNPLANSAGKQAAGAQGSELSARLETPWGVSSMRITSAPKRNSIPFLSAPGTGVQLRVGGSAGYMVKAIVDADRIDEPVEIVSPSRGVAAFTLSFPFRTGMAVRLLDLETGAVYDEAGARQLPIEAGAHGYRLIAGDASFVESRTRAFLAAAPAEIAMSQNFPNPFRGRTHIELRWPAWQDGGRTAVLEVIDMHGRVFKRVDLGEIRVGKQVVTLEDKEWRTGVYLYRLTVDAGGRRTHMQKRMLVTP